MSDPSVSVIVPWREQADRKPAFDFVTECARFLTHSLDGDLTVIDDPHDTPFNRGRALNHGVDFTTGEVLVFLDADMIVTPVAMMAALEAVVRGAAMVVPFDRLIGLTGAASALVLEGRNPTGPWGEDQIDLRWERKSQGGINVLSRATFEACGGFDERFNGWGGEDAALGAAIETLVGPVEYVAATAIHLWHGHADDRGSPQTARNLALAQAYERAWGDPTAMRSVIDYE